MAANVGVQADYTAYYGGGYVTDVKTALTRRSYSLTHNAQLPAGNVLLGSVALDGTLDGGRASFGGTPAFSADTVAWRWETTAETQLLTRGGHHLKLTTQARLDRLGVAAGPPDMGVYTFNSLHDLAANSPALFSRRALPPAVTGGEWLGSVAVGDLWRASRTLSLIYGVRADASRFVGGLSANGAVDGVFGVRTSYTPRSMDVSPRLRFTWTHVGTELQGKKGVPATSIGRASGPTTTVRGGVGEFVGVLPGDLLLGAGRNGTRTVVCSADAVPAPDWFSYSSDPESIPNSCASGEPSAFASSGRRVEFFGRDFSSMRSWRGNLTVLHRFSEFDMSVDGAYSISPNLGSAIDLNFSGRPRFALVDEAERPVFVLPSDIAPPTGVVSASGSRISPDFGPVSERVADMRSVGRAMTITLTRKSETGRFWLNTAYTLGKSLSKQRGFDALTFGDPRRTEWVRGGFDVRHQFRTYIGWQPHDIAFSIFGRVTSGLPFTPIVGSDINGDGLANDRAFLFRPGALSDAHFDAQMNAVTAAAPARIRRCLGAQLGSAVASNSCDGPWTASLDARITAGDGAFHLWHRMSMSLTFTNLPGALDQLVHGGGKLRGWGDYAASDPVLYNVRAFDPVTRRFAYSVNPQFGHNMALGSNPFSATLEASFTFGAPFQVQMLAKALNKGRGGRPGPRIDAATLQKRYAGTVPYLYQLILSESDSLLLTRVQIDTLVGAQVAYRRSADSAWAALATELASLGGHYDASKALARAELVTDSVWALTQRQAPIIRSILSPLQRRLLPSYVIYIITAKEPIKPRYYISG
jgi:hypothetical protein